MRRALIFRADGSSHGLSAIVALLDGRYCGRAPGVDDATTGALALDSQAGPGAVFSESDARGSGSYGCTHVQAGGEKDPIQGPTLQDLGVDATQRERALHVQKIFMNDCSGDSERGTSWRLQRRAAMLHGWGKAQVEVRKCGPS